MTQILLAVLLLAGHPSTRKSCQFVERLLETGVLSDSDLREMAASTGRLPNPLKAHRGDTVSRDVLGQALEEHLTNPDPVHQAALRSLVEKLLIQRNAAAEKQGETNRFVREGPPLGFIHVEPDKTMILPSMKHPANDRQPPDQSFRPSRPFELGTTHVTNDQWRTATGHRPVAGWSQGDRLDHPVILTAHDATLFIQAMNEKDPAHHYRRPTYQEWLYVAADKGRAPTRAYLDYDLEALLEHAWVAENSNGHLHPVKTRLPLTLDGQPIYDLIGNLNDLTGPTIEQYGGDFRLTLQHLRKPDDWFNPWPGLFGFGNPQLAGLRLLREAAE